MAQVIKIDINPAILQWARREAGYEITEIAHVVDVEKERYEQWERDGRDIPFGKLTNIAKHFKRQIAVFLYKSVPPVIKLPHDYRNLHLDGIPLSKEARIAIRRAQYYLDIAQRIKGGEYWQKKYLWREDFTRYMHSDDSQLATWLRLKLDIDYDKQNSFASNDEAFKKWRTSIETAMGVFVFQFPMPKEEMHGFCLTDKVPY
ncbi:XRE family transcriptional regulator, partial [bacterium]|nr:XRE family transcriptional regulator [bacterium]